MFNSQTVKHQKQVKGWREYTEDGTTYRIRAVVRWDDECGNGHNSFSVTGTIEQKGKYKWLDYSGGCIHEEIVKHFPELAPFIKWHLCDSDMPMYYFANTMYLAGDRDCWGLRKGESRQIRNGKTGQLCWILEGNARLEKYVDSDIKPEGTVILNYVPWCRIGEGKAPELDAARRTAIWPDATLEQLTSKEALEKHLAEIMPQFKADVEALGFIW